LPNLHNNAGRHTEAGHWLQYHVDGGQGTGEFPIMSLLGNLVFFVFGGFVIFLGYVLGGILLCLTIIGIPFGFMCFRLAGGVIAPFGREVRETEPPGGPVSLIMNIIWIILPGLELAIMHLLLALFFLLTIVGFPLAVQHMKLVPMALMPFGHVMRDIED
jgi:uncharacterized membrane protein YccF (DUF307 family)